MSFALLFDCFLEAQEICDRVWCDSEKWFNNSLLLSGLHVTSVLLIMDIDVSPSERRTMVLARTVFIVLVIVGGLFVAGFLGY